MRSWKCMVFTKVKNASRNLVSQGFIAGTLPGFCPTLGRPLELGTLSVSGRPWASHGPWLMAQIGEILALSCGPQSHFS